MGHYFYLAATLPPLQFPCKPGVTLEELRPALEFNLSKGDKEKLTALRLFVDISNLRPLWQEQEIDPRGNLGEKELDEAFLTGTVLPEYVFEFLENHETLSKKLLNFSSLLSRFYQEEAKKHTGFLRSFFSFERESRLVMLAIRAKQIGRDVVKELCFEDPMDPLVMQILAQKDAPQYEPPAEYREIKDLLDNCGKDPFLQSKEMASCRFRKIEELKLGTQFSVDGVLAYVAQLMLVEHWNELDQAKGKVILDTFKTS